jgi:hypothetical protein
MNKDIIISNRYVRHGFNELLRDFNEDEYINVFRKLQPVSPIFFTMPGDAPTLRHRSLYNNKVLAERLRNEGKMMKGRFNGGRVGYVLKDEFELYGKAYTKPVSRWNEVMRSVFDYVSESDGIMKETVKEELPFRNPKITSALNRLQEAFLLLEVQSDDDWDTAWFNMESEFKKIIPDLPSKIEIVKRYLHTMVAADFKMIQSWCEFKVKDIKVILDYLIEKDEITETEFGYMLKEDLDLKEISIDYDIQLLDLNDMMIRSYVHEIKEKFDEEILQYLLIDGEIKGICVGHWRIGPHSIDDIILWDCEPSEVKDKILTSIEDYYGNHVDVLKYNGKKIKG